jgi:uncharacterized PurR-regulated membrane protein YhhQ (DUF165 family)
VAVAGRRLGIVVAVAAMVAVVVLSNVLVQYPVPISLGRLNLADLLTWGAFSFPLAFLVTDVTNRLLGPAIARRVVFCGFAIASGTAFLAGQLLDIGIFNWLRHRAWWKAPAFSSLAGSVADTAMFFSLAFASVFAFIGANDAFAIESAPLLGIYPLEAPRWISWALGDLGVKLLTAIFALIPYRVIVGWFVPLRPVTT